MFPSWLHARNVLVLAVLCANMFGCGNDKEAIQTAFDRMNEANAANDYQTTISMVNQNTLDFFQRMRDHAANSGPGEIQILTIMERMHIGMIRINVDQAYLKQLSGPQLFMAGMRDGWLSTANRGKSALTLGAIDVDGDRAEAELVSNGEVAPFKYVFTKEGGQWKHDLVEMFEWIGSAFRQAVRNGPNATMPEDKLVLLALSLQFKKPVGPEIWEKPQ